MDYIPGVVPHEPEELIRFIQDELGIIARTMKESPARNIQFLAVAPKRPREGMIYGADGTNWNPGGGQGVYAYYGGAWTKL